MFVSQIRLISHYVQHPRRRFSPVSFSASKTKVITRALVRERGVKQSQFNTRQQDMNIFLFWKENIPLVQPQRFWARE